MEPDEILEALESTAPNRGDRGRIGDRRVASGPDVRLWRDQLLRFLGELDGDATVQQVREALEEYR